MSAPIPIKFKLTNAGRLAALDAFNSGLNLKLTHIAIGSAKYNSETTGATRTVLLAETGRYPLSGGNIEPVSRTLRFSAILESGVTKNAFEVGLFDINGVLFAVASTTANDPLILVTANIAFVAAFTMVLTDVNVTNLTVVDDPSSPLAIALMNQHIANPDPHPQYPLKSELANIIYPVGSWHGTNNASYNPATALVPLFGYQTTWYLWPYVPAGVSNTSAALGQIVQLVGGSGTQAATTRIWQRLPDGASAPTYNLTASTSAVDEGQQVTFTLNTTGVAQGTAVAWNITGIQSADITPNALSGQFIVGADGSASKTITLIEDKLTEGTETLKFTLTYIAGKFVNVTINDTSFLVERYAEYTSSGGFSYDILIKPNEVIEVVLLGGSGSGGGLYQQNDGSATLPTAEPGFATVLFKQGSPIATAQGGFGGNAGRWNDTGQTFNGTSGAGGSTSASSGMVTVLSQVNGSNGKQTLADHTGGAAAVIAGRSGGEGMSYMTGSSPETYGFGGGAGGGAYIKLTYKNNSNSNETLVLVVGQGGIGAILGVPPQQHEAGDGSAGFASVHWNKP